MKKLQVLIIAFLISLSICAFASMQAKAQDLTVSVSPISWAMDVGQTETFTATPSGGTGTYSSYQWYVGSTLQSENSSSLSFAPASSGSYSITVTVTDSSNATSDPSNVVAVTVNSALVAPTVTAAPNTVNQGQTSSLSSTAVTTGTPAIHLSMASEGSWRFYSSMSVRIQQAILLLLQVLRLRVFGVLSFR